MKTNDVVQWLQLLALVGGFAGVGVALGRSSHAVETNTADLAELAQITRDLAGSSIKTQTELHDLARRVELLERSR
tara:strand:- start:99 stop:326 length:228 start_codon:yes stop_codon:yes gene_type:complete